jgi:hypothetical protein
MAPSLTYHAFYSKKQYDIVSQNANNRIYTNFYKLKDTDEIVEVTSVFRTNIYPTAESCSLNFDDKVYLGIVDKWIKTGKKNSNYTYKSLWKKTE